MINTMKSTDTAKLEKSNFYEEEFRIPLSKLSISELGDEVYFEGTAVTTDHVTELEFLDIDKNFINTPVTYRHDHPSKGNGGSIYGRAIERHIELEDQKDGSKRGVLKFKAKMSTYLEKHKDLIKTAKAMQDIDRPIGWSVGFTSIKDRKTKIPIHAEIFEIATTHRPHDKSALNEVIIMEDKEKDKIVDELRKQFESKYSIKVKEFETSLKEKDTKVAELEGTIKEFEKSGDINKELVSTLKEYEKKLIETGNKVTELESNIEKAKELAKREPLVQKMFELEGSESMKARYLDSAKWSNEDLLIQYEDIKKRSPKGLTSKVITKTFEASRQDIMSDEDLETSKIYESKVKENMSANLKKLLYGV